MKKPKNSKSNSKIHDFRNKRAKELEEIASTLEKVIDGADCGPIKAAASSCRDHVPTPETGTNEMDKYWGYEIIDLKFPVTTLKNATPNLDKANVEIYMKFISDMYLWEKEHDSIISLNFSITISGIYQGTVYYNSFHIDKHLGGATVEAHPLYHVQYPMVPRKLAKPFNSGHLLILNTPRFCHYPIDFILGITLLLSNINPEAYNALFTIPNYNPFRKLHKESQIRIWKPYFKIISNAFETSITGESECTNLIPAFI